MRNDNIRILLTILVIFLVTVPVLGAPLHPDVVKGLAEEGKLQGYLEMLNSAHARGVDKPMPESQMETLRLNFADDVPDTATVIVIMVDFPDNSWGQGYVEPTAEQFDSVLFSEDFLNPTGSMTEYYKENSYGKFVVVGEVWGHYRMPQPYTYYTNGEGGLGDYPNNAQKLVIDAIVRADSAGVDFSRFDTWGPDGVPDGMVDAVMVIHAGPGGEGTGEEDDIHSHKWDLGPYYEQRDGKRISVYTIQPEEFEATRQISPIGIFCHEFGHVLGLPDLYDIDYIPETSYGIGIWSLMASGTYKGQGKLPAHFDAWSKTFLGFVTPVEVTANMVDAEIPQVESEPVIYKLWKDGVYGTEYFLVENRQRVGFDNFLPGDGLLIYHVDDNTDFSNINVDHYHVAIEQADGLRQIELSEGNDGDSYDPYPGDFSVRSFDDLSVPSSRAYDGGITQVSVWDISDSDSLMTANLDVTWSRPNFTVQSVEFQDENGNSMIDLGEDIDVIFQIKNDWLTAHNVEVNFTSIELPLSMTNNPVVVSSVNGDGAVTSTGAYPISFTIPDDIEPTFDSFYVYISSDGGAFGASLYLERQIGQAKILILDDDRGKHYDTVFTQDLYKQRVPADVWEKRINGSPPGIILSLYNTVMWLTGDTAKDYFTSADISAMKYFMDHGGNFFLTGQALAAEFLEKDSAFMENYLKSRYYGLYYSIVHRGVSGHPVFDGISFELYSYNHQYYKTSEVITPVNGGLAAFEFNPPEGGYTGVTYEGTYKSFFLDFGYEDIDVIEYYNKPRDSMMSRILYFFSEDFYTDIDDTGEDLILPKEFNLDQNYPNPFNPVTTISYSIPAEADKGLNTSLRVFNILGQEVITLVDRPQRAGTYSVQWDGTSNSGNKVTSGVYFYQLVHGGQKDTRKMILLK